MDSQAAGKQDARIAIDTENEFTIGQLTDAVATLTGIHCTPAMIYNYERKGLIEAPERTAGGFRLFTMGDLGRVTYIKRWQAEGMNLEEIGHRLEDGDQKFEDVGAALTMPEDRRTQILEAATQAFLAEGYASTTLLDIAEKVDISSAAIYRYFRNKEELFLTIVNNFSFRGVLEQFNNILQQQEIENGEDIHHALVEVSQAFLEIYARTQRIHHMFIAESRTFPEAGNQYYLRFITPMLDLIEQFVASTMKKGLIRDVDIKLAIVTFYGILLGSRITQELMNRNGSPNLLEDNWIAQIVGIYLDGILQPPS